MLDAAIFAVALALAPPASPSAPASNTSTTSAAPSTPSPAKTNDDDKVTCRMIASTGTMIADRECHTNAVWRQMTDDAREEMRENQNPASAPRG